MVAYVDAGEQHARDSLAIAVRLPDRPGRVFGVGIFARIAAERGHGERAGFRWGAIENEEPGAPLGGWWRHRRDFENRIRELVGPEFERGCQEGRTRSLDEAVAVALGAPDDDSPGG